LTLGTKGKVISNIVIVAGQMSFQVSFLFFKINNLFLILNQGLGWNLPMYAIIIALFVLLSAISYIRNIQVFAMTHIFADLMVMLTLLTIVVYGSISLSQNGSRFSELEFAVPSKMSGVFGSSIFAFEGVGIIIPM
jgi:amino acid permease